MLQWNHFTDSIFTPVKNVKYAIENFRVEQKQIMKN
jgi:DNA-directed RNA polymerase alpha subunit